MQPIESFPALIEEITTLVTQESTPRGRVDGVFRIVERAVAGADRLGLEKFAPGKKSYSRHLIHCDPHDRFQLMVIVWRPGQGTPIHDHPTWGVVGVLQNRILFVNYSLEEEGGKKKLVVGERIVGPAGMVTTVYPPICDIHRMGNATDDKNSVTLHCYGKEVTEFNVYSRETAERRVMTVSYDTEP